MSEGLSQPPLFPGDMGRPLTTPEKIMVNDRAREAISHQRGSGHRTLKPGEAHPMGKEGRSTTSPVQEQPGYRQGKLDGWAQGSDARHMMAGQIRILEQDVRHAREDVKIERKSLRNMGIITAICVAIMLIDVILRLKGMK